jgi:signal transduction histidine kinase
LRARFTSADKLLLGVLLPLAMVVASLHVWEVARSGLAQLPVYVAPAPDAGGYPVVGGYRLETEDRGTALRPGDRLIQIGGRDLRGVGYIGFDAIGLAACGRRGEAPLVYERDGVRRTMSLPAVPHPYPWSRFPNLLLIPICMLVLLRAPGSRAAQRFAAAFLVYSIVQAQFYGGPEWQSLASLWLWNAATPVAVVLMLRFARLFPSEVPPDRRAWWGWPWLAGASYLVVRINYVTGAPIPAEYVQRLSHACHAVYLTGTIALLARNYAYATPIGRRRLKWVLLGGALGSAPLMLTQLVPLVSPDWGGFEQAFAIGNLATVFWIVGVVMAVVRYNVFDIDRLIGAAAAYSSVAIAAVFALVAGIPFAADRGSRLLGIEGQSAHLALAMLLAAAVIPLGRRLRPRMDRLLFPERVALENGVDSLLRELSRCPDPDALFAGTADRVVALLRPRGSALYVREGRVLVRRRCDALQLPEVFEPEDPYLERLLGTRTPREPPQADVAFALPFHRAGALLGVLLLGPKRSGDVYTSTDRALLATISEKVSGELLRFRFVQSIRQERERASALRSQKESADQLAQAKTRLLATASHDIRQPLHALGFMVESLAERVATDDARELVERIQSSTDELSAMLSDLLDLSRLESGVVRVDKQPFALSPLLASLETEFAPIAHDKGLELSVEACGDSIESDRALLLRILRNLLSNAIRYTQKGRVCVNLRPRREHLWVEVADSGPGIPAERQREIFGEFRQLRSDPLASATGLGLGLAIVERLAQLLGHELVVRSTPGQGSVFAVSVPRAMAASGAGDGVQAPPRLLPVTEALRGRRIAVVDDDPSVLEATRELLASWGCEVRTASDAGRAEALMGSDWAPDFVLSDYHLDGRGSGIDVIERLRGLSDAQLPAALITGDTVPDRLERLRATGLPVLTKPLAPARLRALLTQALGGVPR